MNIPENYISFVDEIHTYLGEELGVLTGTFLVTFWPASSL